jgi:hypothetical protein
MPVLGRMRTLVEPFAEDMGKCAGESLEGCPSKYGLRDSKTFCDIGADAGYVLCWEQALEEVHAE